MVTLAAFAAFAPSALASQLVVRDAHYPSMAVMTYRGEQVAMVAYFKGGRWHRVLVWGAKNAIAPKKDAKQQHFHIDYSGGSGSFGPNFWKTVKKHNQCSNYRAAHGPRLAWGVPNPGGPWECYMESNNSYWALQVWQRGLPDGGQKAGASQRAVELQVSHWSGPLPVLWLKWDWIYGGRYDHLYGKLTYRGNPVYGFGASSTGSPQDSFGRNVYVDTQDPPWHNGYKQPGDWYRWNGFLAKRPLGNFCAGVYPNQFGREVPGKGHMYRATAMGPGVTPIVEWQGGPPGDYPVGGFPAFANGHPDFNAAPSFSALGFTRAPYKGKQSLDQKLNHEEQTIALQDGPDTKSAVCAATH